MLRPEVIEELTNIVGREGLCTDAALVADKTANTLGLSRKNLGIIYPETTEQVQAIVQAANRNGFALYPYSAAKNIGYGERMPVTDDNLLVDLGRMNRILHVDSVLGYADIEPGVTQGQLSDYLRAHKIPFYCDVTGSGRGSSVIGNSVDGGFGTTPRGNKRKEITCVQGVYGNGELFDSGYFPGTIGPDFAGLFVQSNFGIVTQVRMPLNAVTEDFRSVMIALEHDADLGRLIDVLRPLRQQGTLTNQLVITNALDALGAARVEIPAAYRGKLLTNEDAKFILGGPYHLFGSIAVVGGIYGSKPEVRGKRRTVRRALRKHLKGLAQVRFMSARTLTVLVGVLTRWPFNRLQQTARLGQLLFSFKELHGMMQGVASDDAMIGLLGPLRESYADLGLMWCSSRISTRSEDVLHFVDIAQKCYKKHGYEYPLEMLMVTPNDIITLQKIDWDKDDADHERRARALYDDLSTELYQAGIHPYRLGTHKQIAAQHQAGRTASLARLKAVFDPNGVLSPGRYGIVNRPLDRSLDDLFVR